MTAPAAGGGDTRDGREWRWHREPGTDDECEQVWTCCGGPYNERPHGHYADCARPAAAPAGDTGELREAIREVLSRYDVRGVHPHSLADAVLALPAVRALIDGARTDRARITAVEALAARLRQPRLAGDDAPDATDLAMADRIDRVLGGER